MSRQPPDSFRNVASFTLPGFQRVFRKFLQVADGEWLRNWKPPFRILPLACAVFRQWDARLFSAPPRLRANISPSGRVTNAEARRRGVCRNGLQLLGRPLYRETGYSTFTPYRQNHFGTPFFTAPALPHLRIARLKNPPAPGWPAPADRAFGQISVNHVQIRPANAAGGHLYPNLPRPRFPVRRFRPFQVSPGFLQNHCMHSPSGSSPRPPVDSPSPAPPGGFIAPSSRFTPGRKPPGRSGRKQSRRSGPPSGPRAPRDASCGCPRSQNKPPARRMSFPCCRGWCPRCGR